MRYSVYNKDVKSRDEFVTTPTYVQAIETRDRSLSAANVLTTSTIPTVSPNISMCPLR